MITRRQVLRWLASLGLVGVAISAYAFVFEPMSSPRITRYALTPRRWPSGLKLKVAALADIHACEPWMSAERIRSIVATTNALGADLILLLGDYAAGHHYTFDPVPSGVWAKELAALRAPLGVYSILGNHEWWDDRAAQRLRRLAFRCWRTMRSA
jgi:hypothetical protein